VYLFVNFILETIIMTSEPYQEIAPHAPVISIIILKVKCPRCFVAIYIQPIIQQYKSTTFLKRTSAINENYGQFPFQMEAIVCLPQNRHFSMWVKMNGTESRGLVSPWRMHCMYSGMTKGTFWAEAISNSKTYSLSDCQVTFVWRHQSVISSGRQANPMASQNEEAR